MYHRPVLLSESVDGLQLRAGGIYVDVTFGGGGHSRRILEGLEDGRLLAFDQDEEAQANVPDDVRFTLIPQNFRYAKNFLKMAGVLPVDGLLADLGVSSHQFDVGERGFSFRFDGPLDLRMDRKNPLTAAQLVNSYDEAALADIFYRYGELRQSRRMAKVLVEARARKPLTTTADLRDTLLPLAGGFHLQNKFLAMTFQALRIEVNQEMQALEALLEQSLDILKPGGRLVVISYHSLEDRLVKNFMKTGNLQGELKKDFYGHVISPLRPITRKALVPTEEEVAQNPRARSAKLRIAERI